MGLTKNPLFLFVENSEPVALIRIELPLGTLERAPIETPKLPVTLDLYPTAVL